MRDLSVKLRECRKAHEKTKKILQATILAGRNLQDVNEGLKLVIKNEQRERKKIYKFLGVLLKQLGTEHFDRERIEKMIESFLEIGDQPDGPVGGLLEKLG